MIFPEAAIFSVGPHAGAWVILGAGLLYASSRIGAEALADKSPAFPGRRAIGHWLPIAAMALTAVFFGRSELVMGVIFATSIASLSLVLGLLIYFSSMAAHPATRRSWPFMLPATLIPLIAGFTGRLSWIHALMMLLLGSGIWSVWTDPSIQAHDSHAGIEPEGIEMPAAVAVQPIRYGKLGGAIPLCIAGAIIGGFGILRQSQYSGGLPLGALAAGVLSPILTMPMLASGSGLAQRGYASSMATTLLGIALLNVTVLLPMCVLTWYVAPGLTRYAQQVVGYTPTESTIPEVFGAAPQTRPAPTTSPATQPIASKVRFFDAIASTAQPMPYPLPIWRIDTFILLALSFVLIPVSIGRWTLGRTEAAGLIFGYAIYLAMVMALGGRV